MIDFNTLRVHSHQASAATSTLMLRMYTKGFNGTLHTEDVRPITSINAYAAADAWCEWAFTVHQRSFRCF